MRYEVRARVRLSASESKENPFVFYPFRTKWFAKRAVRVYNKARSSLITEFYLFDRKKNAEVY